MNKTPILESNEFQFLLETLGIMSSFYCSQECDLDSITHQKLVQNIVVKLEECGFSVKENVVLSCNDFPEHIIEGEEWPIDIEVNNGNHIYSFNILLMKGAATAKDFATMVYRNKLIVMNSVNRPFSMSLVFTKELPNLENTNEALPELTKLLGYNELKQEESDYLKDANMVWGRIKDSNFYLGMNLQYNGNIIQKDLKEFEGQEIVTINDVMMCVYYNSIINNILTN